jgi:folylpolyglutamate synthase
LTNPFPDKFLKVPETPFPDFTDIYSGIWKKLDPKAKISNEPTIEAALNLARSEGRNHGGMEVLVTGSLHLVGGALNVLQPDI